MEIVKGFFAYSDQITSIGESIENSIQEINQSELVNIQSWKKLKTSGKYIINEVCRSINESELFLCELSSMNHNVLFELGYAVACQKKIMIFLNTSLVNVKEQFERLGLLTTIGYDSYTNSQNIVSKFWSNLDSGSVNLLDNALANIGYDNTQNNLLYLKSSIDSEASVSLTRVIHSQNIKAAVDDPQEVMSQPITWYIEKILSCNGVIAHLLSDNHEDNKIHNAKVSFISGLSYGLDLPLLMLAGEPFNTPLDYKNILQTYKSASQCSHFTKLWFEKNDKQLNTKATYKLHTAQELKALSELQRIDLGDNVTENEVDTIINYYVRTYSFDEALRRNHSIFIGRKGCGKTANLYSLANEFEQSKQNHVCVIKPVAYEIEGVLQVLNTNLTKAERGYLIESIWKYLIYTELAKSIYSVMKSYPVYYELDTDESNFIEFVEKNQDIILPEFSVRLDYVVRQLNSLEKYESIDEHQLKVSELIHDNVIKQIRSKIGRYCTEKKKVIILIDNLDKSWELGSDLEMLSRFIYGLLNVGGSILRDFSREDAWRQQINLSLIIFLREDIYSQIAKYIPERDKLTVQKILWEDPEVLLRVIEERISSGQNIDIWKKYFCSYVDGISIKEFIIENIIPRPRDLITLIKSALSNAISRQHSLIEQEDMKSALEPYSHFALETLITEIGPQFNNIRELLYEFVGGDDIVIKADVGKAMVRQNVYPNELELLMATLCKFSFLGVEIAPDEFKFIYNEDDYNKYSVMARKMAAKERRKDQRYLVHKAFHANLFIEQNKNIND